VPRDLPVPGRELDGVHFAMEYLAGRNRWVAQQRGPEPLVPVDPALVAPITAAGKDVVVIGGGDTGADCVGNAIREGARSVVQLEILDRPPDLRPDDVTPWPLWPAKYRLSYAMEEARHVGRGEQDYAIVTTAFEGSAGRLERLRTARAEAFRPVPGTEGEIPADLVLLAMGFLGPEQGLLDQLGVERDQRSNVKAGAYATSVDGVFAAGDARRGQSLIVWAINEGRQCARVVDRHLMRDRDPIRAGNVAPADDGPEGPPRIAAPGIAAG
jgi:glutamate synthase (NADPH/NADH) small chain